MIALCVDDEVLLLETLVNAVKACTPQMEVAAFDDEQEALQWAELHTVDVAFMDIRLHGMDGMELAERLMQIHPDLPVIFCTGFRDYAVEAFQMHAAGYLTKPIRVEQVQRELDHLMEKRKREPLLQARCFGFFEVYAGGEALHFKRGKTKELLAYLIDRRGAAVTSKELYSLLWEEKIGDKNGMNNLHQLVSDIRRTLKNAGADEVLITQAQGYRVDMTRIDCDYYRFLEGDEKALRSFTGEYMSNYSWSEYTSAYLQSRWKEEQKT